jgi:dynactin-5
MCASNNIKVMGKSVIQERVMIRGDLAQAFIGRYVYISPHVIIRPSIKIAQGQFLFVPVNIGDYVFIGDRSLVCAIMIGSHVHIGKDCIISDGCVIRNCSRILDGAVLAPDTVVPPFVTMGGNPARIVETLPESMGILMESVATHAVETLATN